MKQYALIHKGDTLFISLIKFSVKCENVDYLFENETSADDFVERKAERGLAAVKAVIDTSAYNHLEGIEVKSDNEAQVLFDALFNVDAAKGKKIEALETYDKSDSVNLFYLNNMPIWLDAATRISLKNRIETEKSAGKTTTILWIGILSVELPVTQVEIMLQALEMYAIACFDNTAKHKGAIMQLKTIDAVKKYDFTTGYPEKIRL